MLQLSILLLKTKVMQWMQDFVFLTANCHWDPAVNVQVGILDPIPYNGLQGAPVQLKRGPNAEIEQWGLSDGPQGGRQPVTHIVQSCLNIPCTSSDASCHTLDM